jgi:galactose mutarotase-like enzyme
LTQPYVSLKSSELSAEIDPHGAQLWALRDGAARDLLWDGDATIWAGRAPILFPIVGMLVDGQYRLGSKTYQLPRHGFARNQLFSVQSSTPSQATFRLAADAETRKVYPFDFELDIQFELVGSTLSLTAWHRNNGSENMPASFGWHPGFRWPLPYDQPRASHFIQFETDEPDPVRRIDAAGLLKPDRLPTPIEHGRLTLTDSLFIDDALILDQVKSRALTDGARAGPRLRVTFPGASFLGVLTKPGGAPFICIEPWHGVTDPEGFHGNLNEKPGVFVVAPGASISILMTVTLVS